MLSRVRSAMRDRLGHRSAGRCVPALRPPSGISTATSACSRCPELTHGIDHAGGGGHARDHAVGPRDDNCLAQLLGRIVASVVTSRPGSAPRSSPRGGLDDPLGLIDGKVEPPTGKSDSPTESPHQGPPNVHYWSDVVRRGGLADGGEPVRGHGDALVAQPTHVVALREVRGTCPPPGLLAATGEHRAHAQMEQAGGLPGLRAG